MHKSLLSSNKQDWCTPSGLFDLICAHLGPHTLDAAATRENALAADYYDKEQDGLTRSWKTSGAVWCNPPYGRDIGNWTRKAAEEFAAHQTLITMLVPSRTDTRWWQGAVRSAQHVIFIPGRIKFAPRRGLPPRFPAPFPSCLMLWGHNQTNVLGLGYALRGIVFSRNGGAYEPES